MGKFDQVFGMTQARTSLQDDITNKERTAHKAAVAQVMAVLVRRKAALAVFLAQPLATCDMAIVRSRIAQDASILGDLWAGFIELPLEGKIKALDELSFRGMSWQSLMQSNPYSTIM
jgi:hypothetical protein